MPGEENTNSAVLDTLEDDALTKGAESKDTRDTANRQTGASKTARQNAVIEDLKKGRTDSGEDEGADKSAADDEAGIEAVSDDADPKLVRMRNDYLRKHEALQREREELQAQREELEAERKYLEMQAKSAKAEAEPDKTAEAQHPEYFEGFHVPDPETISDEYEGEQHLYMAVLSLAKKLTEIDRENAALKAQVAKLPEVEETVSRISQAEIATLAAHMDDCVREVAKAKSQELSIAVTQQQAWALIQSVLQNPDGSFNLALWNPDSEEFTTEIASECFDIAFKRAERAMSAKRLRTSNGQKPDDKKAKQPPDMGGTGFSGSEKEPTDRVEKVMRDIQLARARRGEI